MPRVFRQIFKGLENIVLFSPPSCWSPDWSQKLWCFLKQYFSYDLSQFEGLPILPENGNSFIKLSLCKPGLLAGKKNFMYSSTLPDDMQLIVKKLGATLIQPLPSYVEQHPSVLDNYVMLPDVGGVLNVLVAAAQCEFPSQTSDTWHNWQERVFERLTADEKRTFRKFISTVANVQSKSSFKTHWQNLCKNLLLFELHENMDNSSAEKFTAVAICSKMASKERVTCLPLLTPLLDATDASAVRLANWFGIQPMSNEEVLVDVIFDNVKRKKYNAEQLDMFIEEIFPGYLNRKFKNQTISDLLCSLEFIPTSSRKIKSPSELYDSSDELLCKLFEGQDVFPSNIARNYLPHLKKLGLKTRASITDEELVSVAEDLIQRPSITKSEALLHFIKPTISHDACVKKSNPGVRILLDNLIKHSAVYGDQIKPFQSVFGCNINESNTSYPGTLFRLPLRAPDEARDSEICKKHYSRDDVIELFKLLFSNGLNILIFTQNVTKIKLYHLNQSDKNPTQMKLLYQVSKTGLIKLQSSLTACCNDDFQFLKQAAEVVKKQADGFQFQGLNISLIIEINSCTTNNGNMLLTGKDEEIETTTNWLINQSTGRNESLRIAKNNTKFLPVAGVAIKLIKCEKGYQPLCLIPTSDDAGLIFCFLPLPEYTSLPLHVNGCFALSSNRRHLLAINDKDKEDPRAQWNHALFVDAVIEAYINAFIDLRLIVGTHVNNIFSLWPIAEQNNKQFISLMTDKFYERVVLSDIQLFPHHNCWNAFVDCVILEGNFRFSPAGEIAQMVLLKLSETNQCSAVIEVPKAQWFRLQEIVQQTKKVKLINPIQFFEQYFLPNIECLERPLADCLLIYALFTKDYDFHECLKRVACIPVKPTGKFVRVCDLIHPQGIVASLFKEEEECFPEWSERNSWEVFQFFLNAFNQSIPNQTFCQLVYDVLVELGMKTDDIPVNQLAAKAFATKNHLSDLKSYCNAILQVLDRKINKQLISSNEITNFKTISFLPVKLRPEKCSLHWFGDSTELLWSAQSLYLEESTSLICCIAPILDESSVSISESVRNSLCFKDKKTISFNFIFQQLTAINDVITDCKQIASTDSFHFVKYVCREIYEYLSGSHDSTSERELFNLFNSSPLILYGDKLIKPALCSFNSNFSYDPYLFGLADKLEYTRTFKQLMTYVGVRDSFNSAQYNQCLQYMKDKYGNSKLSADDLQAAVTISHELVTILKKEEKNVEQLQEKCGPVYLPDDHGILRKSTDLVYNTTPWLQEKQVGVNYICEKLGYEILKQLGGKTLREEILSQNILPFARPFGQNEKLTTRLKKIISDYPNNESILREFLQNADDAGCSEIHFILDPRTHQNEKVFSDEWKQLQGPSLLVLNDKGFSDEDLQGIQNLGEGSKGNNSLKTGRYGVGFNCVYHLTDCPTLLTSTPSTGPVLCIFDPHYKFIPIATLDKPGCLLNDVDKLKINFPDAMSCYIDKIIPTQSSVFRLPLRTENQANLSEISEQAVNIDHINSLFENFKEDACDCLLFVRNITSIKVSVIDESNGLQTFCVQSSLQSEDLLKRQKFNENIIHYSKKVNENPMNLLMVSDNNIISYEISLKSNKESSKWLVVQQFGLSQTELINDKIVSAIKEKKIDMLLQGGVAFRLKSDLIDISKKHRLYCFLPLPILTHLPVHINGFFALDHEARRSLFQDGDECLSSYRSLWNVLLMEKIIAPAYVELLALFKEQLKEKLLSIDLSNKSRDFIRNQLQTYLALLPTFDSQAYIYINILSKAVYQWMVVSKYLLFPTLRS